MRAEEGVLSFCYTTRPERFPGYSWHGAYRSREIAGDAFFAGTVIGLTYGKTLAESCEIGSRLAASVICITENVCPRFRPLEFGLDVPVVD